MVGQIRCFRNNAEQIVLIISSYIWLEPLWNSKRSSLLFAFLFLIFKWFEWRSFFKSFTKRYVII